MDKMKSIAVIFLLLGCSLSYSHSEECKILHSPIDSINVWKSSGSFPNHFCWTIFVSSGKFIQLKLNEMTLENDCPQSFVEISSTENEYVLCKTPNFKPLNMTALSNVNVELKLVSPRPAYFQSHYKLSNDLNNNGFNLDYIIKDIECINKDSFKCNRTSCIPRAEVCDGITDCENGADEIGCETGVLATPGVAGARKKAVSWLKKKRLSSWGWRDYTPRGVVALYLASDATFNGTVLEEELMAKETEIKIAVSLLRPSLTNCELSMFIHALLVTCHDPRDFYGNNLVKRLKEQVENSQNVSHPISYLALCNAHASWPAKADEDLKTILNSSLEYPFMKDLQAMAILALSCKANSSENSFTSTTSKLYKHASENLKNFQMQDGSYGNFHTTALVTQALIASGQENNKDWKLNATIQYLMKELNSSSVDFLSVYLTLPILNGKSLMSIYNVNCSAHSRKHGDDPISEVSEFLGTKMRVQYTLYIGDEKDVVHTIFLRVPENYTAFQIMQLAEIEDSKYKFDWKVMSGKMYVYKIAKISNDPETGKFWLLHVRSDKETKSLTHFTVGPDKVVLKDEQEVVFWFKTASI